MRPSPCRRIRSILLPREEIRLRCRMQAQFLERARAEGIFVQEARCEAENTLCLRVDGANAMHIIELAQRYSLKVDSRKTVGLNAGACLRTLWPFACGFCLCMAFLLALSTRVWLFDVRCPQGGDAWAVRAAIEQIGLKSGDIFPQEERLARRLESICTGYAHISVRRRGVILLVEAYRETDAPDVYDGAAARDLVASQDALVTQITVLAGKAAVRPGDIVKKGQVLILGEERQTDQATHGVRALGEASGLIWAYGEAEAETEGLVARHTGRERVRAALRALCWRVPLRDAQDFPLQTEQTLRAPIGGLFVPLYIERTTLRECEMALQKADEESLKAALQAQALAKAAAKLPENAQIVDKWADYSMIKEGKMRVRVCVQASVSLLAERAPKE